MRLLNLSLFYSLIFFCLSSLAQTTDTVIMIEPEYFGFNAETAHSNFFQNNQNNSNSILEKAKNEFFSAVNTLKDNGVKVIVLKSNPETPDAVFPNNYFSTHKDNLIIYPMLTENRRKERNLTSLLENLQKHKKQYERLTDLTYLEKQNQFLEGTGSVVLDRDNRFSYISLSPRSTRQAIDTFIQETKYTPVIFTSYDLEGRTIYHTNVMMSIGKKFAVLCTECIKNLTERTMVLNSIENTGKKIINISPKQMHNMCGNILELKDQQSNPLIIMSKQAYSNFSKNQIDELEEFGKIITLNINTIENVGGGSARCMLAEVF